VKILKNLFDISKSRTVEIEAADRDFFNNLSGRQWLKRFRIGCACRFPARAIAALSMEKGKLLRLCKPGVMARVINACPLISTNSPKFTGLSKTQRPAAVNDP
jgi:hypothetical protein